MNCRLGAFFLLLAAFVVSSVAYPATRQESVDLELKTHLASSKKSDPAYLTKREVDSLETNLEDLVLDFKDDELSSRRLKRGVRKNKKGKIRNHKGIFYKWEYPVG
ncbi:uncharacterized protein LOC134817041 [Bolinopsis microptera]|uniref:uncharacterized protein LOC134817041 n=1 Tax=Bolinopsis microptera TaxID=2820187 RepID=UPI00307AD0C6